MITGPGGTGKTFTITRALQKILNKEDHNLRLSFSTPYT